MFSLFGEPDAMFIAFDLGFIVDGLSLCEQTLGSGAAPGVL